MIQGRDLRTYREVNGVYIHVPFCLKKCPYCAFFSVPYRKDLEDSFISFLETNLSLLGEFHLSYPRTLYIGGGTPSTLSVAGVEKLFSFVVENFGVNFSEVTFEVNPGTVSKEYLFLLKELGVTRISVGVQSFRDKHLAFLGRVHRSKDALNVISWALELGFLVSCDFMFGLPGQVVDELLEDLSRATDMGVHHISLYGLSIEENTEFWRRGLVVDEDLYRDMYLESRVFLEGEGFFAYEISNFSPGDSECLHNWLYWDMKSYLGLGPSAVSFFSGEKLRIKVVESLSHPSFCVENLSEDSFSLERLFLSLRTRKGLPVSFLSEDAFDLLEELSKLGYIALGDGNVFLTSLGALVIDEIVVSLSKYIETHYH